ncbi:hypothetical protein TURU_010503 [Turdus rufiventris]|nr:hypothetical protein TURU_010503 [Turdus rufiventris]
MLVKRVGVYKKHKKLEAGIDPNRPFQTIWHHSQCIRLGDLADEGGRPGSFGVVTFVFPSLNYVMGHCSFGDVEATAGVLYPVLIFKALERLGGAGPGPVKSKEDD